MSQFSILFGGGSRPVRRNLWAVGKVPALQIAADTDTFVNSGSSTMAYNSTPVGKSDGSNATSFAYGGVGAVHAVGLWILPTTSTASYLTTPDGLNFTSRALGNLTHNNFACWAGSATEVIRINVYPDTNHYFRFNRSTDGVTWTAIAYLFGAVEGPSSGKQVLAVRRIGTDYFACLMPGGISAPASYSLARSTDAGVSWTNVTLPAGVTFVSDIALSGTTYNAVTNHGVYTSTDLSTWTLRASSVTLGYNFKSVALVGTRLIACAYNPHTQFFYSDNNGVTWAKGAALSATCTPTGGPSTLFGVTGTVQHVANIASGPTSLVYKGMFCNLVYEVVIQFNGSFATYLCYPVILATEDGVTVTPIWSTVYTAADVAQAISTSYIVKSTDGNTLLLAAGPVNAFWTANNNVKETVIEL